MKKTLIIGLMILSNLVFGQIPGKTIEGPIVLFDTLTVKKGDIIYLGKGSDPETGDFIHLYAPANKTANTLYNIFSDDSDLSHKVIPRRNLDKGFAGKQLVVESFGEITSKKNGNRIVGVGHSFVEVTISPTVKENGDTTIRVISNPLKIPVLTIFDFEPAFKSGEIIKIRAPELPEKAPVVELLFTPFAMTKKGIEPVVVPIKNLSKNELYNKAINWTKSYYKIPNQVTITKVSDVTISVNDIAKKVKFGTMMASDIFIDLPYLFAVDFTDNEIRMTFTLGGKNGDITAQNGEVIANISPSRIFDKNGEVRKMSQIIKVEAEKIMNDLSYAMVDYLMK